MKISIELESTLLCASGESTATIDAFPKTDKYGIPFIPGKTFKGVLKESTKEVCEMLQLPVDEKNALLTSLYGKRWAEDKITDDSGKLKIDNIRVKDYVTVKKEASLLIKNGEIDKSQIFSYFTKKRQQTEINENGCAEEKSLRTYIVVKRNICPFELYIDISQFELYEKKILEKSLINLRYIGLKRNRGFGKISIKFREYEKSLNHKGFIDNENAIQRTAVNANSAIETPIMQFLCFKIKALNPLQIALLIGEQNTVSTGDYIPAMTIRGLIANLLIKKYELKNEAHKEPLFKKIVFNEVYYQNGFPVFDNNKSIPYPIAIGYDKLKPENEREPLCIFDEEIIALRPYKKWNNSPDPSNNKSVHLSNYFHHQREKNRIGGKSIKNDGAIFYYEAIEEDQIFEGMIYGHSDHLNEIKDLLISNNGIHYLGASKSAQYAKAYFYDFNNATIDTHFKPEVNKTYHIVLQSHLILKNNYGFISPNIENLSEILKDFGFEVTDSAARFAMIENYIGIRKAKTNAEYAFAMGSTFRIKCTEIKDLTEMFCLGLGEKRQEGFGKILIYGNDLKSAPVVFSKKIITENLEDSAKDISDEIVLSDIITGIKKYSDSEKTKSKIKYNAFDQANKAPVITNSMIYSLKAILNKSKNLSYWKKELNQFAGMKKGNVLQCEKQFFDNLLKLYLPVQFIYERSLFWEIQKPYWQNVLSYMVKKNRNQNNNQQDDN